MPTRRCAGISKHSCLARYRMPIPYSPTRQKGPTICLLTYARVLTHSMLSIPVVNGRCALGTWQGVYLWEHRQSHFRRRLTITVLGRVSHGGRQFKQGGAHHRVLQRYRRVRGRRSQGTRLSGVRERAQRLADVARLDETKDSRLIRLDLCDTESIKEALDTVLARTERKVVSGFVQQRCLRPTGRSRGSRIPTYAARAVRDEPFRHPRADMSRVTDHAPAGLRAHYSKQLSARIRSTQMARCLQREQVSLMEGLTDTLRMELSGTDIYVSLDRTRPYRKSDFGKTPTQAFKSNIDTESSPHREAYRRVESRLASDDDKHRAFHAARRRRASQGRACAREQASQSRVTT